MQWAYLQTAWDEISRSTVTFAVYKQEHLKTTCEK